MPLVHQSENELSSGDQLGFDEQFVIGRNRVRQRVTRMRGIRRKECVAALSSQSPLMPTFERPADSSRSIETGPCVVMIHAAEIVHNTASPRPKSNCRDENGIDDIRDRGGRDW